MTSALQPFAVFYFLELVSVLQVKVSAIKVEDELVDIQLGM